jgi:acyl-CoA hydrolase
MAKNKRELILRFLAEPTDVNFGGKVHGGIAMKWIDQAGYACATHWASSYCVTVYVGGIQFLSPIHIGDIVEVQCQVIYTGSTSMHIGVDVYSGDPRQDELVKTTHCVIIFVAIDDDGESASVPKWTPITKKDQELEHYAIRLMELRKGIQNEMQGR